MYEFRFVGEGRFRRVSGATEQAAADHVASLVASSCPVPGAYRAGSARAVRVGPGSWRMPTGASIEIRRA